jgi:hypothetical protein
LKTIIQIAGDTIKNFQEMEDEEDEEEEEEDENGVLTDRVTEVIDDDCPPLIPINGEVATTAESKKEPEVCGKNE